MSTPGYVKLRHFKTMSLVFSQILDFLSSRPGSCISSLFQSRPWPAAWRRSTRGKPPPAPPGSPAASCRAAAQAGPPAPPALGPAGSGPAGIGAAEQKSLIRGQVRGQNQDQPQPAPTLGVCTPGAGGACPACPWVEDPRCCSALAPSQHGDAAPVPGTGGQAEGSRSAGGWFCSIHVPR